MFAAELASGFLTAQKRTPLLSGRSIKPVEQVVSYNLVSLTTSQVLVFSTLLQETFLVPPECRNMRTSSVKEQGFLLQAKTVSLISSS